MGDDEGTIRVLTDDSRDWARAHPGFFFNTARPSVQELRDRLLLGARTLSNGVVSDLSVDDWCIVASTDDWFARGSTRDAAGALFHKLHAFPELGQNCSRPEFVIFTFARDVVTRGTDGTSTVKGSVVQTEAAAMWSAIQSDEWQRVIAFRGLAPNRGPAEGS